MAKQKPTPTIEVMELKTVTLHAHIVGTTPLICNSMSQKVRQDLLFPPAKKNKVERATTLKHRPLDEYRRSPYRFAGDEAPTRIFFPGGGFKSAIASSALDIPGATKSQIGRLLWVEQYNIPIYGVPQMLMSVVRNSDMARTPDVRTRAILPEWAARVSVTFATPQLKDGAVINLLAAAGVICGIGDWRPQKGKGNFGQFRIASADDEQFHRIVASGGLLYQDEALQNPTFFDVETEELYEWFVHEAKARGFDLAA